MASDFKPDPKWMPVIARAMTYMAEVYNRYEVHGLENIPEKSGALLVAYHGLVPLDFWYFGLKLYLETGRQPCALVDRWLMKTPGLAWVTRAVGGVSADRGAALQLLREGTLVGVAPGGVREAISGHKNNYKLMWGNRQGFAKLALEANVPIVPVFTENVEGLYFAPLADRPFFQSLYEKTRLPLVPIIGLGPLPFPVKLTTWVGAQVKPEGHTVESLTECAARAINELIEAHQR